jgi:hypothetical protein
MQDPDSVIEFKMFRQLTNEHLPFLAIDYGFAEAEAHLYWQNGSLQPE